MSVCSHRPSNALHLFEAVFTCSRKMTRADKGNGSLTCGVGRLLQADKLILVHLLNSSRAFQSYASEMLSLLLTAHGLLVSGNALVVRVRAATTCPLPDKAPQSSPEPGLVASPRSEYIVCQDRSHNQRSKSPPVQAPPPHTSSRMQRD